MILFSTLIFSSVNSVPPPAHLEIKTYKYTFTKEDNFTVSYSDYPVGQEEFFELDFKNGAKLPREINARNSHGLKISGNNHSDDLFMYAYKKITGLKPNTQYHVDFSIEFASRAPAGAAGVGGSPGDNVYVKIGAINQQPQRYIDEHHDYQIALDKGNQELDGKDMILIGTVGVNNDDATYRLKTLPYMPDEETQKKLEQYTITTDNQGRAWVIFGTDSGFEATSTFFYTNLFVTFKELALPTEIHVKQ